MKVVFDTNILIAAFLTDGLCSKLLLRAKRGEFKLYLCPFILREFQEKLRNKFKATPQEIHEAVSLVIEAAHIKEPSKSDAVERNLSNDPDDDEVIACAVAAGADYLVTGDLALREVREYRAVKFISPRSLEILFEG
jgi:uncharacterized protein